MVIFSSPAFAANISVSPTRVLFNKEKQAGALYVTNKRKDRDIQVQVELYKWSQNEDGSPKYEETDEIIAFPKIFKLDPKEKRVVRIGFKGEASKKEKTFRIFLRELPIAYKGETAIRFMLRIGVPIFIDPIGKKVDDAMKIEKLNVEGENLIVTISNGGNAHFAVSTIKIAGEGKDGSEVFSKKVNGWYVLNGASRPFPIRISYDECSKSKILKVEADLKGAKRTAQLDMKNIVCVKAEEKAKLQPE